MASLVLVGAMILMAPTIEDWKTRHAPSPVASLYSSTSAFFSFDWNSLWNAISGAITSWIGNLNSAHEAVVSAKEKQDAALKEMAQAKINSEAANQMSEAGQEAADMVASERIDACQVMAETAANTDSARDMQMEARANTAFNASSFVNVPSSTRIMAGRVASAFGDYCSPESLARGRCPGGAASPKNMPDADIQAGSMLGTNDSQSQTLSQDEHDAAQRYVQWVTNPTPYEDLPIAMEKTPAGQRYLLEKQRRAAVLSASQYSMNQIIASRWIKN